MNLKLPETHIFKVGDTEIHLPLVISKQHELAIYNMNLMGQAKLNKILAEAIYDELKQRELLNDFDVMLAVEAKSLGLAQEMSTLLNMDEYIAVRKSSKIYMKNPLKEKVNSITSSTEQTLYLDGTDAKKIKGKRVLILEDVISTGATLKATASLIERAGAKIGAVACVATEGRKLEYSTNFVRLGHIPLHNIKGLLL